jgi:hypothetical protein
MTKVTDGQPKKNPALKITKQDQSNAIRIFFIMVLK